MKIVFSDYFKFKAELRGFELNTLENILRYSPERYVDTITQRMITIGRHDERLVLIPYEQSDDIIAPITVHVVTRQQVKYRLTTGRLICYG